VPGGVPVRPLRLRGGARQRDGRHHHRAARALPTPADEGGDRMNRRARPAVRALQYLALVGYLAFLGFPLLWMLSTAFKGPRELVQLRPSLIPTQPTIENFRTALTQQELVR